MCCRYRSRNNNILKFCRFIQACCYKKYKKNGVPSVEKKVQEDSDDHWDKDNTADIGQTVNFQTTITAQAGAQNYVLLQTMQR